MSRLPYHERLRNTQLLTPDCAYSVHYPIASLSKFIDMYKVNLDPDYQRGYVWTKQQKRNFVGAVLQNHNAIPPLWFNAQDKHSMAPSEVVDGKQRISAILGWLNGEYAAVCPCGEEFWYAFRDEIADRNFSMHTVLSMKFIRLDRKGVLKFYLALNSAGTVHTAKDLGKVRRILSQIG